MEINSLVNIGLIITYIAMLLAVVGMFGGMLMNLLQDMKAGMKSIIGVVGLLVLFGLTYVMASPDATAHPLPDGQMKLIGGAMITLYILLVACIALLIFDLVKGFAQGR